MKPYIFNSKCYLNLNVCGRWSLLYLLLVGRGSAIREGVALLRGGTARPTAHVLPRLRPCGY